MFSNKNFQTSELKFAPRYRPPGVQCGTRLAIARLKLCSGPLVWLHLAIATYVHMCMISYIRK